MTMTRTPRPTSRRRRRALATVPAGLAAVVLLAGCGSVSDAVGTAQGLASQAAGLTSVATEVASACATASAAWVPGVSQADAEAALADAADALDAALAEAPVDVPGVGAVRDALTGAQEALQGDAGAFGLSQETLRTACALVTAGG